MLSRTITRILDALLIFLFVLSCVFGLAIFLLLPYSHSDFLGATGTPRSLSGIFFVYQLAASYLFLVCRKTQSKVGEPSYRVLYRQGMVVVISWLILQVAIGILPGLILIVLLGRPYLFTALSLIIVAAFVLQATTVIKWIMSVTTSLKIT